jgi:hypothetical protein
MATEIWLALITAIPLCLGGMAGFAWRIKVYEDQRRDLEKANTKRTKSDEINAAKRRIVKTEAEREDEHGLRLQAETLLRECEARERTRGQP